MYEDLYFQVIEDMVYEHYDVEVGEVIFWYVNGAKIEDEDQYIEDKKTEEAPKDKTTSMTNNNSSETSSTDNNQPPPPPKIQNNTDKY